MAETEDIINLRDYMQMFRDSWRNIAAFTAVGCVVAFIVVSLRTPIYQSSTKLLAERGNVSETIGTDSLFYSSKDDTFVNTQFEILRGERLALRVAQVIKEEFGASESLPPTESPEGALTHDLGEDLQLDATRALTKRQRDGLRHFLKKRNTERLAGDLIKNLRLRVVPKTRIFLIQTRSSSPEFAAVAANLLAEEYARYVSDTYASSAQRSFASLQRQAQDVTKEIEETASALLKLKKRSELDILASEDAAGWDMKDEETRRIRDRLARSNPELFPLQDRLAEIEQEIARLKTRYRENHPTMRELMDQHDRLAIQIEEMKDRTYSQWHKEHLVEQNQIQYAVLEEKLDAARKLHSMILSKINEIDFSEDTPAVSVRILKRADVSGSPAEPKKGANVLLGTISGFLIGITLAFSKAHAKSKLISLGTAEEHLPAPLFGSIPHLDDTKSVSAMLTGNDTSSPAAESIKAIRTILETHLRSVDNNIILVTSPERDEGKSTVTTSLAQSFANLGKKVLLMDVDLRKGRLHNVFGQGRENGLSQALSEGVDIAPINVSKNLDLYPCGRSTPHPSELLASPRMKDLILSSAEKYDIVLMDSPPLLAVTDASLLARYADTRVMVVRSQVTPLTGCEYAANSLRNVGYDIHGIVLNDVKADETHYYGGYYHRYYYRRYRDYS